MNSFIITSIHLYQIWAVFIFLTDKRRSYMEYVVCNSPIETVHILLKFN